MRSLNDLSSLIYILHYYSLSPIRKAHSSLSFNSVQGFLMVNRLYQVLIQDWEWEHQAMGEGQMKGLALEDTRVAEEE